MWFVFALICLLGWGCADLFYKKSSDSDDRNSHLKIGVWVGITMGVVAFCLMPFAETLTPSNFIKGVVGYFPASLGYILSMVIGYAGMRYLEISVVSPIQNASGALSAIAMLVVFAINKESKFVDILGTIDVPNLVGTGIIVVSFIALAIVEQRLAKKEGEYDLPKEQRKYRFGALALIFPVLYCIFDTLGTAADGIILDEEVGLKLPGASEVVGDIDVLILYGLTFFVAGIVMWVVLLCKEKKAYNPFAFKTEWPKATASVFEEFGQIFYVYAMARNPVVAAPMIASYCIVSCILSRIFLKEKLKLAQYICIVGVICGIVILGVAEGLAEL